MTVARYFRFIAFFHDSEIDFEVRAIFQFSKLGVGMCPVSSSADSKHFLIIENVHFLVGFV